MMGKKDVKKAGVLKYIIITGILVLMVMVSGYIYRIWEMRRPAQEYIGAVLVDLSDKTEKMPYEGNDAPGRKTA